VLAAIHRAAAAGAQFIVAPIRRSSWPARVAGIDELDQSGFRKCAYDDLDVVRLAGFLADPERSLRAALGAGRMSVLGRIERPSGRSR
jgi:predicted ATPase